jgi:hypothetical protein
MPTPTYTPLATVTLGSSASSVTFSNIPATYRDLIIQGQFRSTRVAATEDLYVDLNSDTGSNYSSVYMYGGSGGNSSFSQTTSGVAAVINTIAATGTSNVLSDGQIAIMDYSATDKHKSMLTRNGAGNQDQVWAGAHRWANTNAVTTIKLYYKIGSIAAGTTISLYGIAS